MAVTARPLPSVRPASGGPGSVASELGQASPETLPWPCAPLQSRIPAAPWAPGSSHAAAWSQRGRRWVFLKLPSQLATPSLILNRPQGDHWRPERWERPLSSPVTWGPLSGPSGHEGSQGDQDSLGDQSQGRFGSLSWDEGMLANARRVTCSRGTPDQPQHLGQDPGGTEPVSRSFF